MGRRYSRQRGREEDGRGDKTRKVEETDEKQGGEGYR